MNNEPSSPPPPTSSAPEEPEYLDLPAGLLPAWLAPVWRQTPSRMALFYLLGLSIAEVLAVLVAPVAGVLLYFLLLFLLLVHTALLWERPTHRLFLSLTLVPLIRIVSFSLPLLGFRLELWYFFTSVPLFGAAYVVMRQLGLTWRQVGVTWQGWPVQLMLGFTGIGLGYMEYLILRPEPLAPSLTWADIWLPALILLISTGFLEEYIFRGILQVTAVEQLGKLVGVCYVALFFAVLHVGYRSVADVLFVLIVGLGFGFVALTTRSILGVTLAHGLTNISLFLIFPFILGAP